jgi:peptidoglycan/LPS O-acetylase OafA/YrhL
MMIDAPFTDAPPRGRMSQAGRIPVLDGVRGVAILLVIIFHGSETLPAALHARAFAAIAHEGGHLGVDVFFVLSGYLITSILVAEYKRTGRIDLRRFYLRRARRIFPAYYAYLAIVGALALGGALHVPLFGWLLSLFYLTDYSFGNTAVWIVHSWSLAVEEQFYLFWPALIMLLGIARVQFFAFAVMFALPFVRLATYVLFPHQRDSIDVMFHTRLDMLMFGAALSIGVAQGAIPLERLAGRAGTAAAIVAASALVCGVLLAMRFHGVYLFTIGYTITGLGTATLIFCLLSHPAWAATEMLSLRPFTALGRISYSLYLWQQLFLSPENQTITGRFPINFVAAILCAVASYYFIERPFFKPVPVDRAALLPMRSVTS